MTNPSEQQGVPYRVPPQEPSRPGIKFALSVAGAVIAVLVYVFTH